MEIHQNYPLAKLTSLNVGGNAETLIVPRSNEEICKTAQQSTALWTLGYGTNSLISDQGLPGTTLRIVHGEIVSDGNMIIADAGVWWDEVVRYAIQNKLWGIEMMSAIPGGVGGAVVGNIAAYGQAISDTLEWVEVYDCNSSETRTMNSNELEFSYRHSIIQNDSYRHLIILRAAFRLYTEMTGEISYQRILQAAEQENSDITTLDGRRQATLRARKEAGSLWDYRDEIHESNNAGSFFRNPLIGQEQVAAIIAHDETGTTAEQIMKMNQTHGGSATRVSAAHVLLAASFSRGQTWGNVRLHPAHVLKLETLPGATAAEVYAVVTEIQKTVKDTLGIALQPEPRLYGKF